MPMGPSRRSDRAPMTSGLYRLADMFRVPRYVSKMPNPDVAGQETIDRREVWTEPESASAGIPSWKISGHSEGWQGKTK
jgi:hypothetical protein